eukprot:6193493-Pleurochrysis_carterae.AAC.3
MHYIQKRRDLVSPAARLEARKSRSLRNLNLRAPLNDAYMNDGGGRSESIRYLCKTAALGMWPSPSRLNSSGSQRLRAVCRREWRCLPTSHVLASGVDQI